MSKVSIWFCVPFDIHVQHYFDFVINRFLTKPFTTKSIETVKYCQEYFDFSLPSVLWAKRVAKFEVSFECFLSVL